MLYSFSKDDQDKDTILIPINTTLKIEITGDGNIKISENLGNKEEYKLILLVRKENAMKFKDFFTHKSIGSGFIANDFRRDNNIISYLVSNNPKDNYSDIDRNTEDNLITTSSFIPQSIGGFKMPPVYIRKSKKVFYKIDFYEEINIKELKEKINKFFEKYFK